MIYFYVCLFFLYSLNPVSVSGIFIFSIFCQKESCSWWATGVQPQPLGEGGIKVVVLVKEFVPETLEFRNNPGGKAFPEAVLKTYFLT